jgi:hypothetical protein
VAEAVAAHRAQHDTGVDQRGIDARDAGFVARFGELHQQEIGLRGEHREAARAQRIGQRRALLGIARDHPAQVFVVAQRGFGRSQPGAVDVEAFAHALHHRDQARMRDRVSHAQARQRVGLAEGARDDEVGVHRHQRERRRPVRRIDEFGIGLVDHHQHVRRHRRHETREGIGAEPGASGIVRIGDVDQPRGRRDRRRDGVEIVAARHRMVVGIAGCDLQRGAGRLRGDGIHSEPVLRRHDIRTGAREDLRELHQQFMRPVAEQDRSTVYAVLRRQRAFEIAAQRIGIAEAVVDRAEHGFLGLRAGAVGILVRAEFDQEAIAETTAERHEVVPRIVGAQALDAGLGERGEEAFVWMRR